MASGTEPPGTILSATRAISSSIRASSCEAPGVGLVEVDGGAEEVARGELVALASDRLLVPAERGELVAQEPAEVGGRLRWPPAAPRSSSSREVGREIAAGLDTRWTSPGQKSSRSAAIQTSHCLATCRIW